MKQKALLLLGGGLDSTSVLLKERSNYQLHALFFLYGQKAEEGELASVKYFTKKYSIPLTIIKLPVIANSAILKGFKTNKQNKKSLNCLDGRNVIFITIAATYAVSQRIEKILLGYHKEPVNAPFPDATEKTIQATNNLLKVAYRHKVEVIAPYSKLERWELLKLGYNLDREIITKSFTCYEGQKLEECGKCAHCKLKAKMLKKIC